MCPISHYCTQYHRVVSWSQLDPLLCFAPWEAHPKHQCFTDRDLLSCSVGVSLVSSQAFILMPKQASSFFISFPFHSLTHQCFIRWHLYNCSSHDFLTRSSHLWTGPARSLPSNKLPVSIFQPLDENTLQNSCFQSICLQGPELQRDAFQSCCSIISPTTVRSLQELNKNRCVCFNKSGLENVSEMEGNSN